MRTLHAAVICLVLVSFLGCGGGNSSSPVQAPGAQPTLKTPASEGGPTLVQERDPVAALNVYMDGFHFENGDMTAQVEAHHFCSVVSEDLEQCVLFDGNGRGAKLVGIEYVVSRRVFEQLPAAERKLWHSHAYEVKSGTLIVPGLSAPAEHEFMAGMVDTYGKTWRTWHTDQGMELPLGPPVLMAGFTADGQLDAKLLASRDERFKSSSHDRRRARADITTPAIAEGANAWERGEVMQVMLHPATTQAVPALQKKTLEPKREETVTSPPRRTRYPRGVQLYADLHPPESR